MSQYLIKKSTLEGTIVIPASKSHTLRAILFATLGRGESIIHQYLPSTDTKTMIEACRLFGAKLDVSPHQIEIHGVNGKILPTETLLQAGNSGIVLRFCSAISALAKCPIMITGDHSICNQRPMQSLLDGLTQLKVSAKSLKGNGFAPLSIQGPIHSGNVIINGKDSQPISALLIASAFAEGPIEIQVQNPGEIPWIGLTLDWFDRLGIPYENHNFTHYRLLGNCQYEGFDYHVPGDFSSAAFPIAAALITQSELTLKNIDMNDSQGDKALIKIFQDMGGEIQIDSYNQTLHVKKGKKLIGIKVDINDFIDSITILAVVGCFAEGETLIYNASIAKQKECNRIHCIATELRKMGADIIENDDGLLIRKSHLKGTHVNSYDDHRMVMSLAVAALGAEDETLISPIECVSKTFPTFMRDFNTLGANIKELL